MKKDVIAAPLIILTTLWAGYYLIASAAAYEAPEPRSPTWEYPDIPQCDKELWERIREGC